MIIKELVVVMLWGVYVLCLNVHASEPLVLKKAFDDAFKIGVAVNQAIYSSEDSASQNIISNQFNTITIENAMKAEPINPQPGVYHFEAPDQFVNYGKANNMFIVGHTLVWHNQTPDWFFESKSNTPNTPQQQLDRLTQHIKTVAGRYANKVDAWDVVNEVFADDGSYRPTTWVNSMGGGDKLMRAAFSLAEKYAPNTELYYNDFNAWRPEKREGIIRMINMLKAEGIRIDGVGIQAHWGLNFPKNQYIEDAIDAYAAAGVKVLITELDVDVLPLTKEGQIIGTGMLHPQFQLEEFEVFLDPYTQGLPTHIEMQLTARYEELFEIFYRKRNKIDRVTLWGLHDGMSWKNDYPIANRTNYPLLWNRDKTMKPAVNAIINVAK